MKFLPLACLLSAVALCTLRGEDDQQQQKPPEEIPDFSNLDEYIYQPKSTLNFGYRYITGVKAKFSGNGTLGSPEAIPDATTANISRTYRDGSVQPDARTQTVDNGDGTTSTGPITPDGKTNTWTYDSNSQLSTDGFMQYHLYSAQTQDTDIHSKKGKGNLGMELVMARDMGNLGKHWSWQIFGGFSVNDIQAATMSSVKATVTTTTDTYDLFGVTPPTAAYSAPSTNTVTLSDGTTQTYDSTVLLGNSPLSRTQAVSTDMTSVVNHWKLHGAYATFRAGPTLVFNLNDRLHFSVSVGPALIYAGSTYTVDEVFLSPTGGDILDTLTSTKSKVLLGVYGDATLEYDLTDRTGFYVGSFYQNAGGYSQTDQNTTGSAYGNGNQTTGLGNYTTRVQFDSQEGLRTGINFKF